jgi:hypothetical protein
LLGRGRWFKSSLLHRPVHGDWLKWREWLRRPKSPEFRETYPAAILVGPTLLLQQAQRFVPRLKVVLEATLLAVPTSFGPSADLRRIPRADCATASSPSGRLAAVVKGVSTPVEIYEVTGLGPLRTRLQRAAARGLTKFVGREREMDAIRHAADLAKQGYGQSSR